MHIGRHIVQELVLEFGKPEVERWRVPLTEAELQHAVSERAVGHAHDVVLVILRDDSVACVRRPGDPQGAFTMPSGAIHPEESFLDGAAREARAQTGLAIRVDDYLLQVHAALESGGETAEWTTHAMLATPEPGEPGPEDTAEIESCRFVPWDELTGAMRLPLEDSGVGMLAYRSRLHERLHALVSMGTRGIEQRLGDRMKQGLVGGVKQGLGDGVKA